MKCAIRNMIKEMLSYHFSLSTNTINKYNAQINKIPEYEIAYSDISEICNQSKTINECLQKILKIK
jgi:hypothetical protein